MNYSIEQELLRKNVRVDSAKKISTALSGIVRKPGILKVEHRDNKEIISAKDVGFKICAVSDVIYDDQNRPSTNLGITIKSHNMYAFVDRRCFFVNCINSNGLYICRLNVTSDNNIEMKVKFYDRESLKHIKKAPDKAKNKKFIEMRKLETMASNLGLSEDKIKTISFGVSSGQEDKYKIANQVIRNLPSIIEFKKEQNKTYNSQNQGGVQDGIQRKRV